MAIPLGTTARQLSVLSRWAMTVVAIVCVLTWWWPGYRTWGALSAGLLLIWALWLCRQIVDRIHTVPGSPMHLVLLAPVLVLAGHLGGSGLGKAPQEPWAIAGALDMSMLEHLAVLALGIMLVQDLLSRSAGRVVLPAVCGAAMMVGPAAAAVSGQAEAFGGTLVLVGMAGTAVWLTPLWGPAPAADGLSAGWLRAGKVRVAWIGLAVIVAVAFGLWRPGAGLLAVCAMAATLFLGGLAFRGQRALMLLLAIALGTLGGWLVWAGGISSEWREPLGWFGVGEDAFARVWAADRGLRVLSVTVGWVGLLGCVACFAVCLVWLTVQARRDGANRPAAVVLWGSASVLVGGALLARGGLFIPAATVAAAFTWGLLPAVLGVRPRPRPGWVLLVLVALMMGLLGLSRKAGLLVWASRPLGGADTTLHGITGFFLAMVLVWMLGRRRAWLGLAGIAAAALAGGGAELLQAIASERSVQLTDWLAHGVGAVAAVPVYLLCVGARWAESDQVMPKQQAEARYGGALP